LSGKSAVDSDMPRSTASVSSVTCRHAGI
jgi:hypothetical protein